MSNEIKQLARRALRRAVASGEVVKPSTCSDCDRETESKELDAHHHRGYEPAYWFDVVWLCKRCHGLCHGHALLITNEQRRAGAQVRRERTTPEKLERRRAWGHQLGSRHGRESMTQFNERMTPEERSEHARRAAEAVPRDRVGGKGKKRQRVPCDKCGTAISRSWLSRHVESNCRLGIKTWERGDGRR